MWFQLSMDAFSLPCALPVTIRPTGVPHSWCCPSSPRWSCGEGCFLMWSLFASLLGQGILFTLPSAPITAAAQKFSLNTSGCGNGLVWLGFFFFIFFFSGWFLSWLGLKLPLVLLWKHLRLWFVLSSSAHSKVPETEARTGFTTYFPHAHTHSSGLRAFFCGHGSDGTY